MLNLPSIKADNDKFYVLGGLNVQVQVELEAPASGSVLSILIMIHTPTYYLTGNVTRISFPNYISHER